VELGRKLIARLVDLGQLGPGKGKTILYATAQVMRSKTSAENEEKYFLLFELFTLFSTFLHFFFVFYNLFFSSYNLLGIKLRNSFHWCIQSLFQQLNI
jgi:hypothetical protein